MKQNPRVLVVDDDANLRKTLADILRVKGYDVVIAATGTEGVAEARRAFVHVALIDLKLPDMSGIEVMEQIKVLTPLSEAIILTGHAAMETAIEATNKGAFSYLLKPYQIDDLLLHIRHAIDRQRGQEEILRLASFPRMNPNPVIEVNVAGEITYLNPAAEVVFPGLAVAQSAAGALGDMAAAAENGERHEVVREVVVGDVTYEQFLYPVPGTDLIRIYMLNITERKAHENRIKRLNTLLLSIRKINEYLLIAENEEELFRFVCATLQELNDIVGVMIGGKQPDFTIRFLAWAGFSEEELSGLSVRWDDSEYGGGVIGIAAREGKSASVSDVENDPRYAPWKALIQARQIKSAAAVPLHDDEQLMGVLAIYSAKPNAFDTEILQFMGEIASDIAVGVRSLRLDKRLHTTLDNLRKSMNSTVEAIVRMVELRDPYTAGHERRVAQLACAIGKEMGLPERQIEGLHVIGYLHDIGKIAIPAEMLSKPTVLTEIERLIVQSHVNAGFDILKNLDFPWAVAQAVLQHHERLDGSGYPQGLQAQDIILEARILMVADVVAAMDSHRPYRASKGMDAALGEIISNKGKLYDPDVVDACVTLFTVQGFTLEGIY